MNTFSHFLRRCYKQWKSDATTQGDFRPSRSILKMSALIGIGGASGADGSGQPRARPDTFIGESRG